MKDWSQKITDAFRNNNTDRVSQNSSLIQQTVGLGSKLRSFGGNIKGLEARVDSQPADKTDTELADDNCQVCTEKIEHFLKENARLK